MFCRFSITFRTLQRHFSTYFSAFVDACLHPYPHRFILSFIFLINVYFTYIIPLPHWHNEHKQLFSLKTVICSTIYMCVLDINRRTVFCLAVAAFNLIFRSSSHHMYIRFCSHYISWKNNLKNSCSTILAHVMDAIQITNFDMHRHKHFATVKKKFKRHLSRRQMMNRTKK